MSTSYPLHKIKIVLLENVHPLAAESLRAEGFTVEEHKKALSGRELVEAAGDAHLVGIRSKTHLDASFFEQATRLWGVGCFCIGTNQVDLAAAADGGIVVFNAPFSNTRSVAELTIAEIIALSRSMTDRSAQMHGGTWTKSAEGAHEVRGRTLGIVGYGRIGSQVSILAEAMGMRVVYFDTSNTLPLGNAQARPSLADVLREADVVTLHVPATDSTRGMIGAREIALMKRGAHLINNARGEVVDVDALAAALRDGRLAGAALDVFPREPSSNTEPFESPVRGMANVVLTPHIAGSTEEAQRNIADEVATKLAKFMNNGSTSTAVNVPQVELPVLHPGHRRILHFHRNVPGVLSRMHRMMADLGVNITAEYLQSNPRHSYVIVDVEHGDDEALREGLKAIPETIRVRTLW